MNQTAVDQKMREELNAKYKDRVNELCHWDLNVIDWKIIITKWWWSNNRLVFWTEDELQTYLDGVIGWLHKDQWQQYQKDLINVINRCNSLIRLVKQNPEYFSDDFDYDIIEWCKYIKKILTKYVN